MTSSPHTQAVEEEDFERADQLNEELEQLASSFPPGLLEAAADDAEDKAAEEMGVSAAGLETGIDPVSDPDTPEDTRAVVSDDDQADDKANEPSPEDTADVEAGGDDAGAGDADAGDAEPAQGLFMGQGAVGHLSAVSSSSRDDLQPDELQEIEDQVQRAEEEEED